MVELKIVIKEEKTLSFDKVEACTLNVDIIERGKNASESELKTSKLLRKNLDLTHECKIINDVKDKKTKDLINFLENLI